MATKKDDKLKINVEKVPKKTKTTKNDDVNERLASVELHSNVMDERLGICNTNIQAAWDKLEDMEDRLNRVAGRMGLWYISSSH